MDTHSLVNLFHILFVVPLFLYVGISRTETNRSVFNFILVLGLFITIYHLYKGYLRYVTGSPMLWVNLIHVFYVGPILLYIGMKKETTPRSAFEILLLLAFAAGGYHLYNLAKYSTFGNNSVSQ